MAWATGQTQSDEYALRLGTVRHRQARPVVKCAFSPDGEAIAVSTADGDFALLGTKSGQTRWINKLLTRSAAQLRFSHDGSVLSVVDKKGKVTWLSTRLGKMQVTPFLPPEGRVLNFRYLATGKPAAVVILPAGQSTKQVSLQLYDFTSSKSRGSISIDSGPVAVELSPTGRRLLSVDEEDNVTCWDLSTGKQVSAIANCCADHVFSRRPRLAFTNLDVPIAMFSCEHKNKVIDVATGRSIFESTRKSEKVLSLSHNGELLTTVTSFVTENLQLRGRLEVHDLKDAEVVFAADIDKSADDATFSQDGELMAVLSISPNCGNHTAAIWNVLTGRRLGGGKGSGVYFGQRLSIGRCRWPKKTPDPGTIRMKARGGIFPPGAFPMG